MTTATITRPLSLAGVPASAWAFGIRIWVAIVVALAASFWLELEVPSSAALTVAILALPTRGQALDKAVYRSIATLIGVTASVAIIAIFSQARDLLLAALAGWIGLCVYAAGLMDGTRAYAAVLSGYTVALVAIQQLDTPEHVFESGVARGAAIAIGIVAITVVNDVFAAPDSHPQLAARLAVLHGRVRDYAKAVFQNAASDTAAAAGLLRDVAALHPDLTSLASESSTGAVRGAAARSTAVALVAAVSAARALKALPPTIDPAAASRELARRDAEVREGLVALSTGTRPQRAWRTPLYRSQWIAVAAGIRAAAWLALAAVFFVLAGWPTADAALSTVAVVIGLGATTPNPNGFTVIAFVTAPIAAALAGTLEFLVLDGVNEFPLLALALAPFVIGTAVLMTRPNPSLASLGRLSLVFMIVIFAPNNPPAYDPQSFLFTSLFVGVSTALLLAAQMLVPTESNERRQRWLLASARRDFKRVLSRRDHSLTPEEAMFRDATRIAQIPVRAASPRDGAVLAEALSYFDRAAAIRLARAQEIVS
ncbi:MAG TPA: FUSC family protein [Candidatus Sulfotelmatobacter sp.]|nr:FUSC family protein [Candidatus Sulfotelmatobacter sp.]